VTFHDGGASPGETVPSGSSLFFMLCLLPWYLLHSFFAFLPFRDACFPSYLAGLLPSRRGVSFISNRCWDFPSPAFSPFLIFHTPFFFYERLALICLPPIGKFFFRRPPPEHVVLTRLFLEPSPRLSKASSCRYVSLPRPSTVLPPHQRGVRPGIFSRAQFR